MVAARLLYGRADQVPWLDDPAYDRQAVTTFAIATPVPDIAFSMGTTRARPAYRLTSSPSAAAPERNGDSHRSF